MMKRLVWGLGFLLVFILGGTGWAAPMLWDDFSSGTTLDTDKWSLKANDPGSSEYGTVGIVDQQARVVISETNTDSDKEKFRKRLRANTVRRFTYTRATVTIASESVLPYYGTSKDLVRVRLRGGLYNVQGFHNQDNSDKAAGNVTFSLGLYIGHDQSRTIEALVARTVDPGETEEEVLWSQTFQTQLNLDQPYTLSVEYNRTGIVFACDNEFYTFPIQTSYYYPYNDIWADLETRIYLYGGQTGSLVADWDDMYVYGDDGAGAFAGNYVLYMRNVDEDNAPKILNIYVESDGDVKNVDGEAIGHCSNAGVIGWVDHDASFIGLVGSDGVLSGYWWADDGSYGTFSTSASNTGGDAGGSGGCFIHTIR